MKVTRCRFFEGEVVKYTDYLDSGKYYPLPDLHVLIKLALTTKGVIKMYERFFEKTHSVHYNLASLYNNKVCLLFNYTNDVHNNQLDLEQLDTILEICESNPMALLNINSPDSVIKHIAEIKMKYKKPIPIVKLTNKFTHNLDVKADILGYENESSY